MQPGPGTAHGGNAVGVRRAVLGRRQRVQHQQRAYTTRFDLRRGESRPRASGRADRRVLRAPGDARRAARDEFFVEARYPYQVWELEVPLAAGTFEDAAEVEAMIEGFHRAHERVFAVSEPGQHIECIYWKGRATARLRKPELVRPGTDAAGPPVPTAVRKAWFGRDGVLETEHFRGESLAVGHRLRGPAMILEPTTTVVVYPGGSRR